jgi:hypothetical protein
VPAERRAAMKARLMGVAAAGQQATQVAQVQPAREVVIQPERKPGWIWAFLRRPLFAAGAMAALVVGLLWWGAASSLPDSPFYNIKLASENFMLNFAGGPEEKAHANLDLATSRLADIQQMERLGKLGAAGSAIANYKEHMNASVTLWKQTDDGANDRIKAAISASVSNDERILVVLEAKSPNPVKGDVTQLVSNLSGIRQELAKSAPSPTPASGTPTVSATPSKVAPTSAVASPIARGTSTAILNDLKPTTPSETAAVRQIATVSGSSASATPPNRVSTSQPNSTALPSLSTPIASNTSRPTLESTATRNPLVTTSTPRVVPPTQRPPTRTPGIPPTHKPPTRTPASTSTPRVVPPTHKPPTHTPGIPPTHRPPTRTPIVPTNTTVPLVTVSNTSTRTPIPTATRTNTPHPGASPTRRPTSNPRETQIPDPSDGTPHPTHEKRPTETAVPPTVLSVPTSSTCELRIEELEVDLACESGGSVEWSAQIENRASIAQNGRWEAVLMIKAQHGTYTVASRSAGSDRFQAHDTTGISGTFQNAIRPDTKSVRVVLTMTSNGMQCDEAREKEKDCEEQ